jgi:hypothetical protein
MSLHTSYFQMSECFIGPQRPLGLSNWKHVIWSVCIMDMEYNKNKGLFLVKSFCAWAILFSSSLPHSRNNTPLLPLFLSPGLCVSEWEQKAFPSVQSSSVVFFVQGKLINAFCSRENKLKFKIKKLERKSVAHSTARGKAKNIYKKREAADESVRRRGNKEACFN